MPHFLPALVDFYLSTLGPSWINNENWLDGDPCLQQWNGVMCDSTDSTVIALFVLCPSSSIEDFYLANSLEGLYTEI
jgi:hypothetical protein